MVLYALLPDKISIGPRGLLLVIEGVFILPFVIAVLTRRSVSPVTLRIGSMILLGIVTAALGIGIVHMILTLKKDLNGVGLLFSGFLLYGCNILLSALWYWEIDGGGPMKRHQAGHQAADFMFPQQANGNDGSWAPHFLDYLFLAFTGSTALSPADTFPLTRPAKTLMMIEAMLSLTIIVLLAARAVNILGS